MRPLRVAGRNESRRLVLQFVNIVGFMVSDVCCFL
jgi:hypothetical protein